MMTDGELRDQVEGLAARLREARRALDEARSVSGGAARLRELQARHEVVKKRRDDLLLEARARPARVKQLRVELARGKRSLAEARAGIAKLSPPSSDEPSNWDTADKGLIGSTGCALGLALLGSAVGAVAWWLS